MVVVALLATRDRPVFSPSVGGAGAPQASSSAAPDRPVPAPSAIPVPRLSRPHIGEADRQRGHDECMTPDPGQGAFLPKKMFPWGVVHLPRAGGHTGDFGYDVVVHFHGGEGARKALAPLGTGLVLVGIDRGEGSAAYEQAFPAASTFDALKRSITKVLVAESGKPEAHIRKLALSSWSAGYGAILAILRTSGDEGIDALVFLDSLHASYVSDTNGRGHYVHAPAIAGVLAFAERATRGEKAMFLSCSQIVPPNYASTAEVAALLLTKLGTPRIAAPPTDDPLGLLTFTDRGDCHVRNLGGRDERAHCAHLAYLGDAARDVLVPRWGTVAP